MNPTLFEIGVATCMVAMNIALLAWFSFDLAAASRRRMTNMFARAGVNPEAMRGGNDEATMRVARRRCRGCRSEALCERWLAGKAEGDNSFCDNAPVFRALAVRGVR